MNGLSLPQRIAVTEFLAKHFAEVRKDELNPEAVADMVAGERHAAKFGGQVAAWVSIPEPSVRVTDKDGLLAWCRKNLPQAIETVEQVRPDTAKALCEQVKKHGGWVNEDGEVVPVDGIGAGDPSPRVNLTRDAQEIIAAAWRAGDISLGDALPIEAVPDNGEGAKAA
jgi:hypothetical protein